MNNSERQIDSVDNLADRQPGRRQSSRLRGALRSAVILPVTLIASACFTPQVPIQETRILPGCVTSENFRKGGATGTGGGTRIPDRYELVIDVPGFKQVKAAYTDRQAVDNDQTYDQGDAVNYTVTITERYFEGDQKSQDQARARLEANSDRYYSGSGPFVIDRGQPKSSVETSITLNQKGGCK